MFKRPLTIAVGILGLIAAFGVYSFRAASPEDRKAYAEIIGDAAGENQPVAHKVKQKRTQIAKDLHVSKNGQRLHIHLKGDEADLHLEKEGDRTVLVEQLSPVTCSFQEEIFPESKQQSVIWFDATQAHLNYHTQELYAENVRLQRYLIPGNTLPAAIPKAKPLIEGSAQSMAVSMDGKEPSLKTTHFKGTMQLQHRKSPSEMKVEANLGTYLEGVLAFAGDVSALHPIGKVKSQKADFNPEIIDGVKSYPKVVLEQDVNITLQHGGNVHCERAIIDDKEKKAYFQSPREVGEVIYLDNLIDRKGNKIPLMFKSANVQMDLIPEANSSKPRLGHLLAKDNVTVVYNRETTLTADEADYSFKGDPNKINAAISGTVTLKSAKNEGLCRLTNLQGDYVRAEIIVLNTLDSTVVLLNPQGSIQTLHESKVSAPLSFSANKLIWQHSQDVMTLEKNAMVTDSEYGTLTTDDRLVIKRDTQPDGKKTLKNILSNGHTVLTHTEQNKDLTHTLVCKGSTFLDHQKHTIDFNSQPNGEQVAFEDPFGEIKADRAKLTYKLIGEKIEPEILILDGHLKIVNKISNSEQKTTNEQLQYALADHAEYHFSNKEMIMTSSKQNPRVLLFDKTNHFEVSAPGLKIKRNALTGKDSITGQGDVRFNLVEHELEQIKNHFKFES